MVSSVSRNPTAFDRSAIYRIRVQGRIGPSWSDRLEGMTIHVTSAEADFPVTILDGEFSNQEALASVLNALYELHLPILEVKRLTD